MYPRNEYEITEEQLNAILDVCKPTPCIMVGGSTGPTPQDNANRAWAELGKEMGFDGFTVQPITSKGNRFFSAVPTETEDQRVDRVREEVKAKVDARRLEITGEIEALNEELEAMR